MAGFNKSIKFVPAVGLHRTSLSGRRLWLALYERREMSDDNYNEKDVAF